MTQTWEQALIMMPCKHYAPNYLYKITAQMVEEFVDKATRLHAARFTGKELRLGFFSKYGFGSQMESYLRQRGIVFTYR